jgi:hypothetical protein
MDYLRPGRSPRTVGEGLTQYDMWTGEREGWLITAGPAVLVITPPSFRRPTFGLLTQLRSYFDGSVPR